MLIIHRKAFEVNIYMINALGVTKNRLTEAAERPRLYTNTKTEIQGADMKHKYLINLLDPADYLSVSQMFNPETGALKRTSGSSVCRRDPIKCSTLSTPSCGGPVPRALRRLGDVFITTGCCDLTIRKTCRLVPGDIIHIQPG